VREVNAVTALRNRDLGQGAAECDVAKQIFAQFYGVQISVPFCAVLFIGLSPRLARPIQILAVVQVKLRKPDFALGL